MFLFCFLVQESYTQSVLLNEPDFVKYTGTVQLIDSQYLLITKLSVTNDKILKVAQSRLFEQGDCGMAFTGSGRFYLQKAIRHTFVNISTNGFRDYFYSVDSEGTKYIDKIHPAIDTIILDNQYPFEIGNYLIQAELDYFFKNKKFTARTEFIQFPVPYLPRQSIYN